MNQLEKITYIKEQYPKLLKMVTKISLPNILLNSIVDKIDEAPEMLVNSTYNTLFDIVERIEE